MSGKHAVGPWHIGTRVGSDQYVWCADPKSKGCVAEVNGNRAEVEANARLIAAAPELLDLVKAVFLESWQYDAGAEEAGGCWTITAELRQRCAEALRKATGIAATE